MNQTVFWCFAILGLFIWLMFRPFATAPWKILGVFVVLVIATPLSVIALSRLAQAYPLKYDYILQALDQSLGLTAFQVARLFTDGQRAVLFAVYQCLANAMVVWYGVILVLRDKESRNLLYGYLILFSVGACLYGIVPAMGPKYAFGALFPMGHPDVAPTLLRMDGNPNAMPSLHAGCAFLLVLFAGRNRWLLFFSLAFLAGTIAATLAFEHYVIDLVVALPFACFAMEAAYGRLVAALKSMVIVLAWLALIRFASAAMIQHSWALRLITAATLVLGVRAVALHWRQPRGERTPERASVLASSDC